MSQQLNALLEKLPPAGRRFFLSMLVGVIAGVGAIVFYVLLQLGVHLFLGRIVGYWTRGPAGEPPLLGEGSGPFHRWLLFLVPTLGGLLSGVIVYRFAPEAAGHGTDAAIESYHHKGGYVRPHVPLIKIIASAITLGTGGSGGREGPIAQTGAGFGSFLADRLNLGERERRILMATGMGAGIGTIFKSPLAGAIFAGEVLYSEEQIEHEVLVPATIASIIGYSLFCSLFGWHPLFHTPAFHFVRPVELIPYTVLGIACAVLGFLYIQCYYGTHRFFERLSIPRPLKPALGGLLMGTIGFFFPQAISMGYGHLQEALDGVASPSILLGIALLKILATSFSIASGGSGGVFGPSIVIGGALGGAVGLYAQQWVPGSVSEPGAFVVVGMAGFFAGAANTPISTIIMVSEMTGNYNLLVPSMWVCVIAFLLLRRWKLYEKQLPNRLHSPAHYGEFVVDVLDDMKVGDWMTTNMVCIPEAMQASSIVDYVRRSGHMNFPVLDPQGKVLGALSLRDVIEVAPAPEQIPVIAHDLISIPPIMLSPEDKLSRALRLMNQYGVEILFVEDPEGSRRLVGILTRSDLIRAYRSVADTLRERQVRPPLRPGVFETTPLRLLASEEFLVVEETQPLPQILNIAERSSTADLPVTDSEGRYRGMIDYKDLRAAVLEPQTYALLIARDVMHPLKPLAPTDTLADALAYFSLHDFDCLPIVEGDRLVAVVRREDVMERYRELEVAS